MHVFVFVLCFIVCKGVGCVNWSRTTVRHQKLFQYDENDLTEYTRILGGFSALSESFIRCFRR